MPNAARFKKGRFFLGKKLSDLIGQFATIPNSFILASTEISTEAKWLFVILRYHTNSKTGNAFPSYTTIQQITRFHRKTIAKSLKELETAGWLTKQRRFGATTVYALQIPSSSISDTTDTASSSPNSTISSITSATISSSDGVNANQTEGLTRLKEPDRGNTSTEFFNSLKTNPAYSFIDIDREVGRMQAWLSLPANKGRQCTPRFVLNWLNKIERPLALVAPNENGNGHTPRYKLNDAPEVCVRCNATGIERTEKGARTCNHLPL